MPDGTDVSPKVAACMEAIEERWGPVEPRGVTQVDRENAINKWLVENRRSKVSISTIKRAWRLKYKAGAKIVRSDPI